MTQRFAWWLRNKEEWMSTTSLARRSLWWVVQALYRLPVQSSGLHPSDLVNRSTISSTRPACTVTAPAMPTCAWVATARTSWVRRMVAALLIQSLPAIKSPPRTVKQAWTKSGHLTNPNAAPSTTERVTWTPATSISPGTTPGCRSSSKQMRRVPSKPCKSSSPQACDRTRTPALYSIIWWMIRRRALNWLLHNSSNSNNSNNSNSTSSSTCKLHLCRPTVTSKTCSTGKCSNSIESKKMNDKLNRTRAILTFCHYDSSRMMYQEQQQKAQQMNGGGGLPPSGKR